MEAVVVAATLFGVVVSFAHSAGNSSDCNRVFCYPPDQIHTVIGEDAQVICQTQSENDPNLYPLLNGDITNMSEGVQVFPEKVGVNCRFDVQKHCVELPITITGLQELNGSIFQCCAIIAGETFYSRAVNITVHGTPSARNDNADKLAVILPSVIIPLAVIAVAIATLTLTFIWRRHYPHKGNKDTDQTDSKESQMRGGGHDADSYNSEDELSDDTTIMVTPV